MKSCDENFCVVINQIKESKSTMETPGKQP